MIVPLHQQYKAVPLSQGEISTVPETKYILLILNVSIRCPDIYMEVAPVLMHADNPYNKNFLMWFLQCVCLGKS